MKKIIILLLFTSTAALVSMQLELKKLNSSINKAIIQHDHATLQKTLGACNPLKLSEKIVNAWINNAHVTHNATRDMLSAFYYEKHNRVAKATIFMGICAVLIKYTCDDLSCVPYITIMDGVMPKSLTSFLLGITCGGIGSLWFFDKKFENPAKKTLKLLQNFQEQNKKLRTWENRLIIKKQ